MKNQHKDLNQLMLQGNDFESLRRTEFLGDSLLAFIVKDYLYAGGIDRHLIRTKAGEIVSNKHLADVVNYLKVKQNPTFLIKTNPMKAKANQIEAYIYQLYIDKGFDTARKFIIERIVQLY